MVLICKIIYSVLKVRLHRKSGDNSAEATPVPISNTEVKLLSADDTWWEAAWESRTLPVFYLRIAEAMRFFFTGSASVFYSELSGL